MRESVEVTYYTPINNVCCCVVDGTFVLLGELMRGTYLAGLDVRGSWCHSWSVNRTKGKVASIMNHSTGSCGGGGVYPSFVSLSITPFPPLTHVNVQDVFCKL